MSKELVWLHGQIKSPPLSEDARIEAGYLLRKLQRGDTLTMPHSRPMPVVGVRCHELRLQDVDKTWRIIYRVDSDAIVIVDVFEKRTQTTPVGIIGACKKRLALYGSVG